MLKEKMLEHSVEKFIQPIIILLSNLCWMCHNSTARSLNYDYIRVSKSKSSWNLYQA